MPEGCDLCRTIIKYAERKCERFLTDREFTRFERVLDEAATGAGHRRIAALRLLMLTGCRQNETLTLR